MNRDVIKYIAMFTMILNHIANIFLDPGTLLFSGRGIPLYPFKEKVCQASGCVCADF